MKRALLTLILLATGQASAGYCYDLRPIETRNLDKILSVTLTDVFSSGMTLKETSAYADGLLRSRTEEWKSSSLGNSSYRTTYTYTATGKVNTIDRASTSRSGTSTNREVYEYDTQGRLTRVLTQDTPRVPIQVVATCTYGPSSITELNTTAYGFKQKTLIYTLDAAGRVTQLTTNTKGDEEATDFTNFTYRNGALISKERRVSNFITPLSISFTEYNESGFIIREEEAEYNEENKASFHSIRTYTYDMDELGNWKTRREYSHYEGVPELVSTDIRVISYKKS